MNKEIEKTQENIDKEQKLIDEIIQKRAYFKQK